MSARQARSSVGRLLFARRAGVVGLGGQRVAGPIPCGRSVGASEGDLREYRAEARSTDVFGRVLCNAREQHFVIDGPIWNGCPGEALTPGEAFLAGVAGCGVELAKVIAAEDGLAVGAVRVRIHGVVDREHPVREDL